MVPFNLMKENGKAAYLDTGTWSVGNKEAKPFGETVVVVFKRRKLQSHSKRYTVPMMQIISLY
jgi:phosphoserine aminotransferase